MNDQYVQFINRLIEHPDFRCPVCGSSRYVTDQGNHELTFHCSSAAAKFWNFDRNSPEQLAAKQHWDQSKREVFLNMEDLMKFVAENESLSEWSFFSGDSGKNQ